jgi:curved DNA-binding protein CbpA
MSGSPKDHYAALGVDRNAGYDEIKQAWRKLAKKSHPDTVQSEDEKIAAHHRFVDLLEAYTVLIDAKKRADYDRALSSAASAAQTYSGYENADAARDQKEASDWFQSIMDEAPGEFATTTIVFLAMSPIMAAICLFTPVLALGLIIQLVEGSISWGQTGLMMAVLVFFSFLSVILLGVFKDLYFRLKRIARWMAVRRRIKRTFGSVFKNRKPGRSLRI